MSTPEEKSLEAKKLGNKALAEGNADDAIKYFSAGLTYTPKNHALLSNRSAAHVVTKNYDLALEDAKAVIECKPDWPKGYSRKGQALYLLDRAEESVTAYKAGLQLDSENKALKEGLAKAEDLLKASEWTVLGEEFLNKKKYVAALDYFAKAVALAPSRRLYWVNQSHAQNMLGKYKDAVTSAERAIQLSPDWHRGFQRKAEALAASRQYDEALPFFAYAIKLAPPDNATLSKAFSSCQQEAFNARRRAEFEAKPKDAKKAKTEVEEDDDAQKKAKE